MELTPPCNLIMNAYVVRIKKDAQASNVRQLVPYAGIILIRFTDPAFAISAQNYFRNLGTPTSIKYINV